MITSDYNIKGTYLHTNTHLHTHLHTSKHSLLKIILSFIQRDRSWIFVGLKKKGKKTQSILSYYNNPWLEEVGTKCLYGSIHIESREQSTYEIKIVKQNRKANMYECKNRMKECLRFTSRSYILHN